VDVEDGEEDGDADHGAEVEIGFLDLVDADNEAVGGGDDEGLIGGDGAFGVAEEVEDEENQGDEEKGKEIEREGQGGMVSAYDRVDDQREDQKEGKRDEKPAGFFAGGRHMRHGSIKDGEGSVKIETRRDTGFAQQTRLSDCRGRGKRGRQAEAGFYFLFLFWG
jgi:hypothetical protein